MVYTQDVGEAIGLSPLDLKGDLIAWHTFAETGDYFDDWSNNNYYAINHGTVPALAKRGYGCAVAEGPNGYVHVPTMPSGLTEYMCAFWFKPSNTLTSGNSQSFRILSSDPFCGDNFATYWDYTAYSPYKGWYLLNNTQICKASDPLFLGTSSAGSSYWGGNNTIVELAYSLVPGSTILTITAYSTTATTITWKSCKSLGSNRYDIVNIETFSHAGGGAQTFTLSTPYVVPTSDTYYLGLYITANMTNGITTGTAYYAAGNVTGTNQLLSSATINGAIKVVYSLPSDVTNLRLKGNPSTNWFGGTWTASTLYFKIPKNTDWEIETKFRLSTLSDGQAAGIIFFNLSSYLNYASIQFKNTGGASADTDQTVAMTSNTAPSPFTVEATTIYNVGYPAYKAFDHVNDAYGWCSLTASGLPQSIVYGFGSSAYNITRYRLRSPNTTDTSGFPKDFTLYGNTVSSPSISNESHWAQVDFQVGISRPGTGTWTAWFDIDTPGNYTHYRLKTTAVSSNTYVWIGEIELASSVYEPGNLDVLVQTSTFSYTAREDITGPTTATDYKLRMLKKDNLIKFKFWDPSTAGWQDTIYEVDVSLWGSNMAFGLQSRNTLGASPEVQFDYVAFTKGKKPPELGDLEEPGRFVVSYNETGVSGAVGPRDDGRIWLETKRDGLAYGTATHDWDSNTWYLLQAGVKSNGDYCWWVNAQQERGLTVGSGNTIGSTFLTSSGVSYFDNGLPPTTSGAFVLDEVSHWSRWLTAEESLKLINKVSQVQWLCTEGYKSSNVNVYEDLISISGSIASRSIQKDLAFYYYGQYQCASPSSLEIKFQSISYRIQRDLSVVAWEINPVVVNIARCSSGWLANQMGCFGCMTAATGTDSRCQCLVMEQISVYALGANRFDLWEIQIPRTMSLESYNLLIPTNTLTAEFREQTYDFQSPQIYTESPANNTRMVDADLDWTASNALIYTLRDYGSLFRSSDSRLWIKRRDMGYNSYVYMDNFSFYEADLKTSTTPSIPVQWSIKNLNNSSAFKINKGFTSTVDLDFSATLSGVHQTLTTSGLDISLETMRIGSFHCNPSCNVDGTNTLQVTTSSGIWDSTQQSAPLMYWPGITQDDWEISTKVKIFGNGPRSSQSSGLIVFDQSDSSQYIQVLANASGICARDHTKLDFLSQTTYSGIGFTEGNWVWLKVQRKPTMPYYRAYWSLDGTTWSGVNIQSTPVELNITMSGTTTSGHAWTSSSNQSSWEPWKASYLGSTGWQSASGVGLSHWIKWKSAQPEIMTRYRLVASLDSDYMVRSFPCQISLDASIDDQTWNTIDYRGLVLDPGSGSAGTYFYIDNPQPYQYYRLTTLKGAMLSYYTSTDTIFSWGTSARLRKVQWDGDRYHGNSLATGIVNVGLITLQETLDLDSVWNRKPAYMTSNAAPSPWTTYTPWSSIDPNVFRLFDSDTGSRYYLPHRFNSAAPQALYNDYPGWFSIDCGSGNKMRIQRYGYWTGGHGFSNDVYQGPVHFMLQGSDDYIFWETVDTRMYQPRYGNSYTLYFNVVSPNYYRYYRYVDSLYTMPTDLGLRDFYIEGTVLSGTNAAVPVKNIDGWIDSYFDYFRYYTPSGIATTSGGDTWELLYDGVSALNSEKNSGIAYYDKLTDYTSQFKYALKSGFQPGEQVYLRFQAQDAPSFKISYTLSSGVLLYVPVSGPESLLIDSNVGATASGYYTLDESPHAYRVFSRAVSMQNGSLNSSTVSCVPTMSGITTSGVRVTENVYLAGNPSWQLFDKNSTTLWYNNTSFPYYTVIDFGYNNFKYINKYRIQSRTQYADWPRTWVFQGSNDGSTWTTVHTVSSSVYVSGGAWSEWYTFTPPMPYRYYRWYITASHNSIYIGVVSMELVEELQDIYANRLRVSTANKYYGTGSINFSQGSQLFTENLPQDLSTCDWTFHTWLYSPYIDGNILSFVPPSGFGLLTSLSGSYLNASLGDTLLGRSGPFNVSAGWNHLGITKKDGWIATYMNGTKSFSSVFTGSTPLTTSTGTSIYIGGSTFSGSLDSMFFQKEAPWNNTLIYSNMLDQIISFNVVGQHDLTVNVDVGLDTESPVIIPKAPLPYDQLICPSSGIEFEILDDYSGVKWTEVLIKMNDITVWSGGNNMTEWFDDRGTLVYDDLGKVAGEWENIQLSASGIDYTAGINRILYPPGTVYSGSGAWGRRFTYYVPEATEIGYFGSRMTITITGTDSIGFLSRFDDKFPNTFSGQYYFDFIPNDNIRYDDVFMHTGHSMRVDEMEARGVHFWVDLFDSNYPVTDIVEDECSITWTDGVNNFTCSGAWFTTWTGVTASGEDVYFHRMHWDPGNHWDWIGNRAVHLTVESHNNDPTCDVYNREEYILFYGWQLNWWHQAVPNQIPPFEFNTKFPIFVSVKTYDFAPSRSSKSYMLWSSPGYTCDLPVYIKPKPIPKEDLKVGILAQSQYLQYSEDVEVEVACKDLDGNELVYTWAFRTEDQPE
jgi:hypothetical protein